MKVLLMIVVATLTWCCHAGDGSNGFVRPLYRLVVTNGLGSPLDELVEKAESAIRVGRFDAATNQYAEIEGFFATYAAAASVRIGDILVLQGRTNAAIRAYQNAMRKYPCGAVPFGAHAELERLTREQNQASHAIGANAAPQPER